MNMPKNIGDTDRNIRFIAGGAIILFGLFYTIWWLGLIGLVLIGTAYLRSCPAYMLIGMDTNKK